jgi:hypothetical protein
MGFVFVLPQELGRQERGQDERDDDREERGEDHGQPEGEEELADDPPHEGDGGEHDQVREGRRRHGHPDLRGPSSAASAGS